MPMVSLAHHWMLGMRGGEKVLEQFCLLFPSAPITTLVADSKNLSALIKEHHIKTSILQYLGGKRFYKQMMPLFPGVVRLMSAGKKGGVLLSSDASVVKGIRIPQGAKHICYCHSPPRYLWDLQKTYEEQSSEMCAFSRFVFRCAVPLVREFDRRAAQRIDYFIANSRFVQERIHNSYGRASEVIYPPVDVYAFDPTKERNCFYLLVSELTPYKRVDLAVEAFKGLRDKLIIIGDGPEGKRLRSQAPENVKFLGRQPFSVLKDHMETCRAFLHPQIEDFGITAVEAQAAGAPVIAFSEGGALETIIEGKTGLFFDNQSAVSIREAINHFNSSCRLDPNECRQNAEKYRPERFRKEIMDFLKSKLHTSIFD